jgi:heme/copper-type cytochrome/quinol oxidase subunit 2
VLTLFCCLPLGVAGIVTSAMAMSRAETQPESARSLLKWSWILAGAALVLGLIVIVLYIVFVVRASSTG